MEDENQTRRMADVPRGTLPDTLQSWVDERAATEDQDPSDVLSRAVTLYRLVEEHVEENGGDDQIDRFVDQAAALDELDEQLSAVDDRLTAVEDDVDEKVDDVRGRVIQVKREGDEGRETLEHRLDEVESTVDGGFENFESILSRLADGIETSDERLTRLAAVVVALRRRTAATEQRVARLDTAAELKNAANRQGETKAKCDDCSGTVSLGLLTEPRCPHCDATFADIEPTRRPFSAARLTTHDPPALTAGDDAGDGDTANHAGAETGADRGSERLEHEAAALLEESNRV